MTQMQWRIWLLACAGKFFEGVVVFMTGLALPLFEYSFSLSTVEKGFLTAATLAGITLGATLLGRLSDRWGRRTIFIIEMVIMLIFLVGLIFANSLLQVVICLFGIGIALGSDYPTAHLILSESIPSQNRGKMVLSAFGFQAFGALCGMLIGVAALSEIATLDAWRWMYASILPFCLIVLIGRITITESPQFLLHQNKTAEAERALSRLLKRTPAYPKSFRLKPRANMSLRKNKIGDLFSRKRRRATVLASIPWFLQDMATYGIGIFTPTVITMMLGQHNSIDNSAAATISADLIAAKGAAMIDVWLLVGFILAVFLTDRLGRMPLLIGGFIGCAIGVALVLWSMSYTGQTQTLLLFGGFILYNIMNNMGPNAQTYLIAGEVFPTHIRGLGAGFAATVAKTGAMLAAFSLPWLLVHWGLAAMLSILIGTSLLGAVISFWCRIETKGIDLDAQQD
ncbi:MFS transporter [Vibrio sp. SM6]|uniref:MFS transporter n=2 Tax=Vibrio agarilyticus TaxID=2726741 RepID=A0A7X8YGG8_9VIBR|nr:MFS transporter [Vibrio agarilyticus]